MALVVGGGRQLKFTIAVKSIQQCLIIINNGLGLGGVWWIVAITKVQQGKDWCNTRAKTGKDKAKTRQRQDKGRRRGEPYI